MLSKITLTNIASYLNEEVVFSEGINVIAGPNGSGKSTLVKAIGLVLFDALPQTNASFIRSGKKVGVISLEFRISDKHYLVGRSIGLQPSYELFESGIKLTEGKDDTLKALRSLFGLSPEVDFSDLWQYVIGVAQGEHNTLFNLTETKRKQVISSILNLDKYERAWHKLRETTRYIIDQMKEVAAERDKLKAVLESWGHLKTDIAKFEQEKEAAEKNLGLLLGWHENIKEGYNKAISMGASKKPLERQRDALLKELENIEKIYLKRQELEKAFDEASGYALIEEEAGDWYYKAVALKQVDGGYCPFCGQPVSEFEIARMVGEYNRKANTLISKLPQTNESLTYWLDLRDNLRSDIGKTMWASEDLLANKQSALDEVVANLAEIGQMDPEAIIKERDNVLDKISRTKERLLSLTDLLTQAKGRFSELALKKEEVDALEAELQKLNRYKEASESAREAIRNLSGPMAERLLAHLSEQSTLYVNQLGFDFKLQIDSNYAIILDTVLGKLEASQLSGGQQTGVSVAFRLALSRLVSPSLNILVLDEPTGNLDQDHQMSLSDRLSQFESSQLLIVTHNQALFQGQNRISLSLSNNKTVFN